MKSVFFSVFSIFSTFAALAQPAVSYFFSSNLADSSGNGRNATGTGITYGLDIAGQQQSAGVFDGSTSYLEVPNSFINQNTTALGVSIWFKTNNNQAPSGLSWIGSASIGGYPSNYTPLLWIDSSGYLCGFMYDGGIYSLTSKTKVNDNQWHHGVFQFNVFNVPKMNQKLFVDGKLEDELFSDIVGTPAYDHIYVGACNPRGINNNMPDHWFYFDGTIDNVTFDYMPDAFNLGLLVTKHPTNIYALEGQPFSISGQHTRLLPDTAYSYTWYKDGSIYANSTNDTALNFASGTIADGGDYQLEITIKTSGYKIRTNPSNIKVISASNGISKINNQIKNIYPNPVNDLLNVFLEMSEHQLNYEIFDAQGKSISGLKNTQLNGLNSLSIPVRELANGIYFLNMNNGKETFSTRFVK